MPGRLTSSRPPASPFQAGGAGAITSGVGASRWPQRTRLPGTRRLRLPSREANERIEARKGKVIDARRLRLFRPSKPQPHSIPGG
jgi:hypothetical protein